MGKRRTHSPEFKARVAKEVISGRKSIQRIAADHAIGLRNAAHLPVRPDPGEPVEAAGHGWRHAGIPCPYKLRSQSNCGF
jgi:hypothetical protein